MIFETIKCTQTAITDKMPRRIAANVERFIYNNHLNNISLKGSSLGSPPILSEYKRTN